MKDGRRRNGLRRNLDESGNGTTGDGTGTEIPTEHGQVRSLPMQRPREPLVGDETDENPCMRWIDRVRIAQTCGRTRCRSDVIGRIPKGRPRIEEQLARGAAPATPAHGLCRTCVFELP